MKVFLSENKLQDVEPFPDENLPQKQLYDMTEEEQMMMAMRASMENQQGSIDDPVDLEDSPKSETKRKREEKVGFLQ